MLGLKLNHVSKRGHMVIHYLIQAIIWINDGILLIEPLGINFSEFFSEFEHFHLTECTWKCRLRNSVHFVSASMCYFIGPLLLTGITWAGIDIRAWMSTLYGYHNLHYNYEKISAISSETVVSGTHWTIPTQYFWPRVFGAPIIYVIPVTWLTSIHILSRHCSEWFKMLTYCDVIDTRAGRQQLWRHSDRPIVSAWLLGTLS